MSIADDTAEPATAPRNVLTPARPDVFVGYSRRDGAFVMGWR